MAQDLSSLFSKAKRKTPDLDLTPEASQVVARDFNLFYKAEEEPVDPTVGIFLKSLDDFVNQAGTKMVIAGEKKEKEVDDEALTGNCVYKTSEAEAETGLGKTYGYLIPSILNTDKKIVVSTSTHNLQEQLFNKDIPKIVETLNVSIISTIIKGMRNYICKSRLQHLIENIDILN